MDSNKNFLELPTLNELYATHLPKLKNVDKIGVFHHLNDLVYIIRSKKELDNYICVFHALFDYTAVPSCLLLI